MKAEIVPEMQKFRDMLDERGIPWIDASDTESKSDYPICRTHLAFCEKDWSIINGYGSYGGWNRLYPKNIGKLEVFDYVNEPIGFLTAEQAFSLITTGSTNGGKETPNCKTCKFDGTFLTEEPCFTCCWSHERYPCYVKKETGEKMT